MPRRKPPGQTPLPQAMNLIGNLIFEQGLHGDPDMSVSCPRTGAATTPPRPRQPGKRLCEFLHGHDPRSRRARAVQRGEEEREFLEQGGGLSGHSDGAQVVSTVSPVGFQNLIGHDMRDVTEDPRAGPMSVSGSLPFRRPRSVNVSAVAALLLIGLGVRAVAQAPPPAVPALNAGGVTFAGSVRTRVESWDWFGDAENGTYAYPASLVRFGLGRSQQKRDWQVEFSRRSCLDSPNSRSAPDLPASARITSWRTSDVSMRPVCL